MGRTLPTATGLLHKEKDEWKEFRLMLPKSERKLFDEMFGSANLYNYAIMMSLPKHRVPIQRIMMSILFRQYTQLVEMEGILKLPEESGESRGMIDHQTRLT
jgi:hypothetical protein